MILLQNKVAVITGCNKGIGQKTVEVFSENGAKVFACVREISDEFKSTIKDIELKTKNQIIPIQLDLSKEDTIKKASDEILSQNGSVDILVNNAGIIHTANFHMTSSEKLKELFEINFFSQSKFTQYVSKSMIKNKRGNIVYVSSTSGLDSNQGRGGYSSTKAALISQSKTLSKELGIYNIRVNSIAPGLTDTDMMQKNTSQKVIDEVINNLSIKRIAKPKEIANTILFLASDLSSYITGQTIRVDGGM